MKKLISILILITAMNMAVPSRAIAAETETCTTVYGQGVVCGKKVEEFKFGLAEDLRTFGIAAIAVSGAFFVVSKKQFKGIEE